MIGVGRCSDGLCVGDCMPLSASTQLHAAFPMPFLARTWLVAFVTDASAGRNFERLITQRRLGTRPEGAPASSGPGQQQRRVERTRRTAPCLGSFLPLSVALGGEIVRQAADVQGKS